MTRLSFFAFLLLFISACCDEEFVPEIPDTSASVYSPLAIGNYWIYQEYREDQDGNFVAHPGLDSVYIEKDTVVDGNTFFILEGDNFAGSGPRHQLRRDSAGYLIDENGKIRYSPSDNDGIVDTRADYTSDGELIYVLSSVMQTEQSITVPAGSFESRALVGTATFNPSFITSSCEVNNETHYVKDIGMVRDQAFYVSGCRITKIELVRYNVNK